MPKESGHDLVIVVAFVVVGSFCVHPSEGTRGLETLVYDFGSGDAECVLSWSDFVDPRLVFLEYEAFRGIVFWR